MVNCAKYKDDFQFRQYHFEFDGNNTELTQEFVNFLNLDIILKLCQINSRTDKQIFVKWMQTLKENDFLLTVSIIGKVGGMFRVTWVPESTIPTANFIKSRYRPIISDEN